MISSDWPQNSLLDSIEFRESGRELSAEFTDFRSHEMEGAIRDFLDERITIIHDDKARACLDRLGGIPRMSTMAIGFVLHKLVEMMPDGLAFLNIGVWHGFSFFAGAVGNAGKRTIGVDNFSEFGGPRDEFLNRFEEFHSEQMEFHDVDFREYLREHHSEPLGVYFFDGPHRYEDQLDGLILAEQFFARVPRHYRRHE